ncbi:MAG: hypothetical protein JO356_20960 [Acidobacteria bacterium]|nr:hypothetical protein [Acidobacteriota bacterium]
MRMKLVTIVAGVILSGVSTLAQSDAEKTFNTIKSLAGVWEGKNSMGDAVRVANRITAGGSALVSEIQSDMKGRSEDMISMVHMDGNRLLLTHYCAAGNQPRLVASTSPDGKTIIFDFLDATNLANSDTGHMQRVIFTIRDATHHSEDWYFRDHGKEIVEKFDLARKG